jgi:hypothetical protein
MFVTNHVLAGASIGTALTGRPVTAFVVGVASHLAMDACPHWGLDPAAPGFDEEFLRAARIDGCTGLVAMATAAAATGRASRPAVLAAMVGAALPDLDKPVRLWLHREAFPHWFQHFHGWLQWESPRRLPVEAAVGVALAGLAAASTRRTAATGRWTAVSGRR